MANASTRPLLFLGASTAFLEIEELINDINEVAPRHRVIGLLDDDPAQHGKVIHGVPVLGPLELARDHPEADLVFGIGSYRSRLVRHEIIARLGIPDERFVTLVHPTARIYRTARIGPGSIIHAGVLVLGDAVLDGFNVVTFGAMIGPFVHLGRYAMVASLAILLTRVELGQSVFVGAGACIEDGRRIGPGALVGMAAAVYRDVEPGAVLVGNPARVASRVAVPADLMHGWESATATSGLKA